MTQLSADIIKRWEKIFPQIKPVRNRAANRNYLEKDLKLIFYISDLIYIHKLSEDEVKEKLKEGLPNDDSDNPAYLKRILAEIKMEVKEIKKILEE